jgi:hypothetical protein
MDLCQLISPKMPQPLFLTRRDISPLRKNINKFFCSVISCARLPPSAGICTKKGINLKNLLDALRKRHLKISGPIRNPRSPHISQREERCLNEKKAENLLQ